MSSELMIKISGQITIQGIDPLLAQLPFGLTVELTATQGSASPGGWIGAGPVNPASCTFEIFTAYSITQQATVNYTIYRDTQLVQQGQATVNNYATSIQLTADAYNDLFLTGDEGCGVVVAGNISLGEKNIAAVPVDPAQVKVFLYKGLFRGEELIGSSTINALGNYRIYVPRKKLYVNTGQPQMDNEDPALAEVYISIKNGQTVLVQSPFMRITDDKTTADLHISNAAQFPLFKYEFDNLRTAVMTATGLAEAQLYTITTDGDNPEIDVVVTTTGQDAGLVKFLVDAYKLKQQTTAAAADIYALFRTCGGNLREWANLSAAEIVAFITQAFNDRIVSSTATAAATATIIGNQAVNDTKAVKNEDNNDINTLLTAVITAQADVDAFVKLSLNADPAATTESFWNTVETQMGSAKRVKLQQGMQLLGLTGMQPETTKYVLNAIGTQPVRTYATKTLAEWTTIVNTVCSQNSKLCVPFSIRGNVTDPNNQQIKNAYAQKLYELFTDTFATVVMGNRISTGQVLPAVLVNPQQSAAFITANPEYDLRSNNIWDYDLAAGGYPVTVREDLMRVQNILRVTGGKPDTVVQLLNAGIKSSADITGMSQPAFITAYGPALGGAAAAAAVYKKAGKIDMLTANLKTIIQPNNFFTEAMPKVIWTDLMKAPPPAKAPDLETLFGSVDLCSCSECMSMYSPSAYFTDIMHFIQDKLGTAPNLSFKELIRRRGDLQYIDLTCKNANTAIPYVDLINELLELVILKSVGAGIPFQSYQTTGSSKELDAYPEHTYRDSSGNYVSYDGYMAVYDTVLNSAVYPNTLPLHLALEESRTYFEHLGYKRYDLMQYFRPKDYTTAAATLVTINEYTGLAEWLRVPKLEADIISRTANGSLPTALGAFYGLAGDTAWFDTLMTGNASSPGLNLLLERARITYKELLQLLNCDFLNKKVLIGSELKRPFEIISTSADPDTCILDDLQLQCNLTVSAATTAKPLFFDQIHRFLRLRRATGWSIYQLDIVLNAFAVTDFSLPAFKNVGNVHLWSKQWRVSPESICAFWGNISTTAYINYDSDSQDNLPSLYDKLFRNKSLINPPDPDFGNPLAIVGTYAGKATVILAGLNILDTELTQLLSFLNLAETATVTLAGLSRLYALTVFIKGNGLSVDQFIRIADLFDVAGSTMVGGSVSALYTLMQTLSGYFTSFKGFIFNLEETEYLLENNDPSGAYIPTSDTINIFYDALRTELKKTVGELTVLDTATTSILKNIILRAFSTSFGLEGDTAQYLLGDVVKIGAVALVDYLSQLLFINSTGPVIGTVSDAYLLLQKIAMLIGRFKLSQGEVMVFFTRAANLDVFNISTFPVTATSVTLAPLQALMRFNDWVKVKGRLNLLPDEFIKLLRISSALDISGTGAGTKANWKTYVNLITGWAADDLNILLGDTTIDGLVNILGMTYSTTTASNDYRKAALILQIADIIGNSNTIGLGIAAVYEALKTDITMPESRNVRKAAKAKHTEDEWLSVAKPLQDTLREKQRKALADYLVVRPDIIGGNYFKWKTENDLFAYFLIDVEMQPCMKTSRIKQAISSTQLYMDRIILNLENDYSVSATTHITIDPEMTAQWRSWRKWYRVWEANRKIFLYPENWIEPELRDNKTPFFKELETQLLQDEVKDNTVEDAYMAYLESLEEVARLEPVGCYHQVEKATVNQQQVVVTDKVHVFGRTSSLPHRYYYRVLEDNEWSPWEKINADIKSDHITPVIWNRKLYLFWLTFQKKKPSQREIDSRIENYMTGGYDKNSWVEYLTHRGAVESFSARLMSDSDFERFNLWDVTLNWSQFKDGKWLANELSKDTMNLNVSMARLSDIAKESFSNIEYSQEVLSWLTNGAEIKIDEFFKNRLYLYAPYEDTNNEEGVNFSIMFTPGLDETATGIHAFKWRGSNSQDPVVMRYDERGYQIMAPLGTRTNKMKFVEDPFQDGKLRRDNTVYSDSTTLPNTYYSFSTASVMTKPGIVRSTNDPILDATPNGTFEVTARGSGDGNTHPHFQNPLTNMFLFEDEKNTFFVRWEPRYIATAVASSVAIVAKTSFSAAETFSATAYKVAIPSLVGAPKATFSGSALTGLFNPYGYRFHTFYHAQIKDFIKVVDKNGIPGLLRIENQWQSDTMAFGTQYQPTSLVHTYPKNNVQFGLTDAYSIYNWEVFFHAPMLIAQRLMDNQQFEEAQQWFHYIFNPTSNTKMDGSYSGEIKRFWKFYPFYRESETPTETLTDLLEAIHAGYAAALEQVDKWEKNPFNPHLIARMRVLAYMKNVFMKYLDNLIAWGDQLFRRDTIESINEATQLYILAANLLGKRPPEIPARAKTAIMNYLELAASGLDALSDSLVSIESYFAPSAGETTDPEDPGSPYTGKMFYFCLPKNEKLAAYWDTVADRLFKIRNCMSIDGAVRQLPLYEPPIDPALLVRAAAMGVDINSILDTVSGSSLPNYRFSYMLQKANEFCSDVRGLGSSLLSALEKKDAEALALIRSGQEISLLEKVKFIKENQVTEAETNLEAIKLTRENTQIRYQYYSSRLFTNSGEQKHLQSIQAGLMLQVTQGAIETTGGTMSAFPDIHFQGLSSGSSFGGTNFANIFQAASAGIGIAAAINNAKGSMSATLAGYERRRDDWNFQAESAQKEIEQMDQQVLAAEIRLDIAKKELANHEQQMADAQETNAFMRNKFTNKELYSWMITQVSATYFQCYQLAYDLAKQAEQCYSYELPVANKPGTGFIKFGYWDSLRKGLMSGEKLQFDLRKLEAAYMEENRREFELTKSFSLAMINPQAIVNLIKGDPLVPCEFNLDSIWYDLDFPGHYMRKIKSVSISIPCVAGPYTTVAAKLTLNSSSIQKDPASSVMTPVTTVTTAIATSMAQNDAGVFELNFRDERYIPFENAGAVSSWRLDMMNEKLLRQFDYTTIADIIIHVKYTAREDTVKAGTTMTDLKSKLGVGSTGIDLPRFYSLKHEFSAQWVNGFSTAVPVPGTSFQGRSFTIKLKREQFPAYCEGKTITIAGMNCVLFPDVGTDNPVYKMKVGSAASVTLDPDASATFTPLLTLGVDDEAGKDVTFILYKEVAGHPELVLEASDVKEFLMTMNYKLSS